MARILIQKRCELSRKMCFGFQISPDGMIDNLNDSQDACKNGRRKRSRGDFGQDSFFHEAGKRDRKVEVRWLIILAILGTSPTNLESSQPPQSKAQPPSVASEYVGSVACARCHQQIYESSH